MHANSVLDNNRMFPPEGGNIGVLLAGLEIIRARLRASRIKRAEAADQKVVGGAPVGALRCGLMRIPT